MSGITEAPFEATEFPYLFLTAFANKDTTIKRLMKGDSNATDVPGAVLQRSNIHLIACVPGKVHETVQALRTSPRTLPDKANFIPATDGKTLEAEDLIGGEVLACDFNSFADHIGFFLKLTGIATIKRNSFDVRADVPADRTSGRCWPFVAVALASPCIGQSLNDHETSRGSNEAEQWIQARLRRSRWRTFFAS